MYSLKRKRRLPSFIPLTGLAILLATAIYIQPAGIAQESTNITKDRESTFQQQEKAVIRASAAEFVSAFNSQDAKRVAALWTMRGEYINEQGQTFRGRSAIEKEYEAFFKKYPKVRIRTKIDSIRLIGDRAATEEGTTFLTPTPLGDVAEGNYIAMHVHENGKWLMASVREQRREVPRGAAPLRNLEWFIGDWESRSGDKVVKTTYRWLGGERFIERSFTVNEGIRVVSSGTQIIGWDPATQEIQSWIFSSDGSHGHGVWKAHQSGWSVTSTGVMPDGNTTTSVNVITRTSPRVFGWKSVNRSIGNVRMPDTSEIVVERVLEASTQSY